MNRSSPWGTPFAYRTWSAGLLWVGGGAVAALAEVPDHVGWLAFRLDTAGLLYTAAALIGGWNFAGAGWRSLRSLRLDMNFLMSTAIIGAIMIGEPFEAAALGSLFSLAELLERFATDRGRRAIARLVELAPERADRLGPDGSVDTVEVAVLRPGDRVRIRPGDKIPVDGRVVAGASHVNEATITGESRPTRKGLGDPVFAATLNADGALDVEVTADAAHSTLARIVQLVQEAEGRRAPVDRLVKRFARVYTPIVAASALLVMVGPPLLVGGDRVEWFVRGLTLLVIACPCALVIATPVTMVSALTAAARHGILIKGGDHLERLGTVQALALDKTGTLTIGELQVREFQAEPQDDTDRLLRRIASVEARSEHPIGRAIVRFALARGIRPDLAPAAFRAEPGQGVRATIEDQDLLIGTEIFTDTANARRPQPATTAATYVHASTSDGLRGTFAISDAPRPEARDAVARLHALGIQPIVMLTGDARAAAEAIGNEVGMDDVMPRLLPEDKVDAIRDLQRRHGAVIMVGDGVNDAPALAQADVGIAMAAAGAPAAIETADVALMGDDLSRLPFVIALARRARRTIRFNIAIAIGTKLLLVLGAVLGMVTLAQAVLVGDLGASLVVTLNALVLGRQAPVPTTAILSARGPDGT